MLDTRIYTFLELCKWKNYTKTGLELNMTQPSVTQHIQYLEKEYGVKLFQYANKKLTLTEEGSFLQDAAMTMAANEKKLIASITGKKKNKRLTFGATLTIGEFVLPAIIKDFIKDFDDMDVTMVVENTSILIEKLKAGVIDFAFVEGYFKKEDYEYHLLLKDDFIAVCSQDFKHQYIQGKEEWYLDDLLKQTIIVRERGSGTREIFERVLGEHNLSLTEFKRMIEIGSMTAIKDLVVHNCGITFLYRLAVEEELYGGKLIKFNIKDFEISREFNFIMLKNNIFREDYIEFLNYVREKIGSAIVLK